MGGEKRRPGRPWGPPRGHCTEVDEIVGLVRSWLDRAAMSVRQLHRGLTTEHFSDETVPDLRRLRERLAGEGLQWDLVEAVADLCFPEGPDRAAAAELARAKDLWSRARHLGPPAPVPESAEAALLAAHERTIRLYEELEQARLAQHEAERVRGTASLLLHALGTARADAADLRLRLDRAEAERDAARQAAEQAERRAGEFERLLLGLRRRVPRLLPPPVWMLPASPDKCRTVRPVAVRDGRRSVHWSPYVLRPARLAEPARRAVEFRPAQAAVTTVHLALRVLDAVARHRGGIGTAQLARSSGLRGHALEELLRLLVAEGLLVRAGTDAFTLWPGAGDASADAAEARLQRSLALTRDTASAAAYFARYDEGEVTVVAAAWSPQAPLVEEWVDFRTAAHATAIGKSLLAQLGPEQRMDHLARHPVHRLTPRTITSPQVLLSNLDDLSPRRPALSLEEYAVGTVCAAIPTTVHAEAECLAVSLPVHRAHRLPAAVHVLQRQAVTVMLGRAMGEGPAVGGDPSVDEAPMSTRTHDRREAMAGRVLQD
ncbi:IclR family transcriptional regulator C-terminal domain-containing protein [Streptomyces sp. NPDC101118]|uniref:IclR family transcriptional regulator domain-containing protein n=1 Tax=Streptomyces sp. NPDC101118 TaxID=3366109 RepID=UPI0038043FB3